MIATFYPSTLDVLGLHDFIMQRTRGTSELRDEGALDGALHRPQTAAHYDDADMATQTVLLITGVALAHAFVDGNKRAALIVGDIFLERNDWAFTGTYLDLAKQIEAVVARPGSLAEAEAAFIAWLRPKLRRRS